MWFIDKTTKHILNSKGAEFSHETSRFDGAGKTGMMISPKEFVTTLDKSIVVFNEETGIATPFYEGQSSFDGCVLNPAGIYLVAIDHAGLG